MSVKNIMMAAAGTTPSVVSAEAIDFDGVNDRLTRSTDFTGNTDGKTFTFSAWIWYPTESAAQYVFTSGQGFEVTVRSTTSGSYIQIIGRNAAGGDVLVTSILSTGSPSVNNNTFYHLLVSIDMTNTANRFIYINDVAVTPTWTTYSNTNGNIDFTLSADKISVGEARNGGNLYKGRLSNLFLDYTYRDLSVTANRRLFVTADLKPAAGQAALNPIMYLPMSDPTQPGLNQGTGGNLTLTGTVARSGRGPNQYNVPYSTFNGTSDQINHGNFPTATDYSKLLTIAFTFKASASLATGPYIIRMTTVFGSVAISVRVGSSYIGIFCQDTTGTEIINGLASITPTIGRNYNVVISLDLSNTAKRHIAVNGVLTATWNTYNTAGSIGPHTGGTTMYVGGNNSFFPGQIGGLYYAQAYIDLTVAANLAKFVTGTGIDAKPMGLGATGELPTGTSALVYLPLYGNAVGKNYGTGGNFNMPTFPSSRGPNEFWGNWARQNLSGYSYRTSALVGASTSTAFTFSAWANFTDPYNNSNTLLNFHDGTFEVLRIRITSGQIQIYNQSGGTYQLRFNSALGGVAEGLRHLMVSIDMTNAAKRAVYLDGVLIATTYNTYDTASSFAFGSCPYVGLGCYKYPTTNLENMDGKYGEVYFTDSYVDLTQEANRLKFRDAFGNPTDLPAAIAAGSVPNPLIYARFAPGAYGTNAGTGGNFTSVNITDGGQF